MSEVLPMVTALARAPTRPALKRSLALGLAALALIAAARITSPGANTLGRVA